MRCLQRLEIQPVVGGDDDPAIDHATLGQLGRDRRDQFGEVAGHRPLVATAQLDLIEVAEAYRLNPSHFGSSDAPGGSAATDFDSIGKTGGMTGSFIGLIVAPMSFRWVPVYLQHRQAVMWSLG